MPLHLGHRERITGPEAHEPIRELGVLLVLEQEERGCEARVERPIVTVGPAVEVGISGRIGLQGQRNLVDGRARAPGDAGLFDGRTEDLGGVVEGRLFGDHDLRDHEPAAQCLVREVFEHVALPRPESTRDQHAARCR